MDVEMQSTVRELTLDDLPIEILVNIIKFVPKSENKNISLVNKKFYAVVCEAEKFKCPLKLSGDEFYDLECLQMLRTTKRKFNQVEIKVELLYQQELNELLDIHGGTVKEMKIFLYGKQRTNSREWIEMFEKVPNLEELKLQIDYFIINNNTNAVSQDLLPNLKNLEVCLKNGDLKAFFDCLNSTSIENIKIDSYLKGFEEFISRQTSIKDLHIPHYHLTQGFAHLPQLQNFTVFVSYDDKEKTLDDLKSDQLMKLIHAHPNLKEFHVLKGRYADNDFDPLQVRGDIVKALCHLSSLEQLSFKLDDVKNSYDMADFTHCSAKAVRVDYETMGYHPTFKEILKMKNIEKLRINNVDQKVNKKSSQKVRHLIIKDVYDYDIGKILRNFQGLEKLEAEHMKRNTYTYEPDGLIHWRLKEISFVQKYNSDYHFAGEIVELLEALPNVETFNFPAWIEYSTELFKALLSMKNLKNLNMRFELEIYNEHFEYVSLGADDINLIRALCMRLKKFKIELSRGDDETITTQEREALKRELSDYYYTESFYFNSSFIVKSYSGKDEHHW